MLGAVVLMAGCSSSSPTARPGTVLAVGAENQYGNVLEQLGGRYVTVSSILDNPNADPHSFEASTSVATEVASASLIVQNGAGYDGFMNDIEQTSPGTNQVILVVQHLLGLPATTPNPHLWYSPNTMEVVARAIAHALATLEPAHRHYFEARLDAFDASLLPWDHEVAAFKAAHPGLHAAVTEPVADDLLEAMGITIATPWSLQADVMNGVDPSPQAVSAQGELLASHEVQVLCANAQVTDAVTASIRHDATAAKVPIVGVYETMPTPGYSYQRWMEAETTAIAAAVTTGRSTEQL